MIFNIVQILLKVDLFAVEYKRLYWWGKNYWEDAAWEIMMVVEM